MPNNIVEPESSAPGFLSEDSPKSIIFKLVDSISFEKWQLLAAIKAQFSAYDSFDPTYDIHSVNAALEYPKTRLQIMRRFFTIVATGVDTKYVDHVRDNPVKGLSDLLVRHPSHSSS